MKKNKIFFENSIPKKYLKDKKTKNLSSEFKIIFEKIERDVSLSKKTLNIINRKYFYNFNQNELKRFNNFKKVVLIGMGGSILGAEAIYSFLKKKIKKKFYFFNDLDENNILQLKKKAKLFDVLFIIISKSGNTTETISNFISLNIVKKKSKNIIIVSEKKK